MHSGAAIIKGDLQVSRGSVEETWTVRSDDAKCGARRIYPTDPYCWSFKLSFLFLDIHFSCPHKRFTFILSL